MLSLNKTRKTNIQIERLLSGVADDSLSRPESDAVESALRQKLGLPVTTLVERPDFGRQHVGAIVALAAGFILALFFVPAMLPPTQTVENHTTMRGVQGPAFEVYAGQLDIGNLRLLEADSHVEGGSLVQFRLLGSDAPAVAHILGIRDDGDITLYYPAENGKTDSIAVDPGATVYSQHSVKLPESGSLRYLSVATNAALDAHALRACVEGIPGSYQLSDADLASRLQNRCGINADVRSRSLHLKTLDQ